MRDIRLSVKPRYVPLLMVVVAWAFFIIPPASILLVPALLVEIGISLRRRLWLSLLLVLLLNPFSVFFASGILGYLSKSPELKFVGLPSFESFNVDPTSRCLRDGGGCLLYGNEWVFILGHNSGLRFACMIFGPPSNGYTGPYPTRQEALDALQNGKAIRVADLFADRIPLADGTARLEEGVGPLLLNEVGIFYDDTEEQDIQVHAGAYRQECIILRLQYPWGYPDTVRTNDLLVLVDRIKGRPFAYYVLKNGYISRIPHLRYDDPVGIHATHIARINQKQQAGPTTGRASPPQPARTSEPVNRSASQPANEFTK